MWDVYHDAPFGLVALQSPLLRMAARDDWERFRAARFFDGL